MRCDLGFFGGKSDFNGTTMKLALLKASTRVHPDFTHNFVVELTGRGKR